MRVYIIIPLPRFSGSTLLYCTYLQAIWVYDVFENNGGSTYTVFLPQRNLPRIKEHPWARNR